MKLEWKDNDCKSYSTGLSGLVTVSSISLNRRGFSVTMFVGARRVMREASLEAAKAAAEKAFGEWLDRAGLVQKT